MGRKSYVKQIIDFMSNARMTYSYKQWTNLVNIMYRNHVLRVRVISCYKLDTKSIGYSNKTIKQLMYDSYTTELEYIYAIKFATDCLGIKTVVRVYDDTKVQNSKYNTCFNLEPFKDNSKYGIITMIALADLFGRPDLLSRYFESINDDFKPVIAECLSNAMKINMKKYNNDIKIGTSNESRSIFLKFISDYVKSEEIGL